MAVKGERWKYPGSKESKCDNILAANILAVRGGNVANILAVRGGKVANIFAVKGGKVAILWQ
jgi:hypothetical protein